MCEYVYMGHPLFETPPYIKMNTNTHIVFVHIYIYIHIHVDNQKPYILFNLFIYIHKYVKIKRYIIIYIYIHFPKRTWHMQQKAAYTETSDKRK